MRRAGPARAPWAVAARLQAVRPLGSRRHLGAEPTGGAARRRRRRELDWREQVDTSMVRAHQHAADAPKTPPRGLTLEGSAAQQGMAAPRGACQARCLWWEMGVVDRWWPAPRPTAADPNYRAVGLVDEVRGRPDGSAADASAELVADKPYGSRANRAGLHAPPHPPHHPRARGPACHRLRRGRRGGLSVAFRREQHRRRNQVERGFNRRKQRPGRWRPALTSSGTATRLLDRRLDPGLAASQPGPDPS